jgi:RNA polymerase sigma factor (sigma-70 family)
MAASKLTEAIEHLRRVVLLRDGGGLTDGQLMDEFVTHHEKAALAALVHRHGPMVWGVCWRVLRNNHDAEDAFQSTFLVFVRKAASVVPKEMIGNWLYGVAYQTALNARAIVARRRQKERPVIDVPQQPPEDKWNDLLPLLDQELSRLPDKYRAAIVLCDLEGKTRHEAAKQLGLPEGTVASQVARGRTLLAKRLARRGAEYSGGALAAVLSQNALTASVPAVVLSSTIKAVTAVTAGQAMAGLFSAKVAALSDGVVKTMYLKQLKAVTAILLAIGTVAIGGSALYGPLGAAQQVDKADVKKPNANQAEQADKKVAEAPNGAPADVQEDGNLSKPAPAKKDEGRKDEPQTETISFKGLSQKRPEWELYGEKPETHVKFEPEGLRITLPTGFKGPRALYQHVRPVAGLSIGLLAKGDFEITTSYEFLDITKPAPGSETTRFTLDALLAMQGSRQAIGTVSRRLAAKAGHQYFTWWRIWHPVSGLEFAQQPGMPAPPNKRGRLRMARTGETLQYYVAVEDGPFELIDSAPLFPTDDLVDVRLVASTGDETAALDVRITELTIRAASIEHIRTAPIAKLKPVDERWTVPKRAYPKEYHLSLKAHPGQVGGWQLEGPKAEECVRWQPDGLHIHLPAGWEGERPGTGIKSRFLIKGDFEASFNFDILNEEGSEVPTLLSLEVVKDAPQLHMATVSRGMNQLETLFATKSTRWNSQTSKAEVETSVFPIETDQGRLRLIRSGGDIYFGVAKHVAGVFQCYRMQPFGKEDVREVRIVASTGGPHGELDARITDLRIRADDIPNMPTGPDTSPLAQELNVAPIRNPQTRRWLIGGAAAMFAVMALAFWFFQRRRPK